MNKKFSVLYLIIILSTFFANCNSKALHYPEIKKILSELNAASDSVRIPKTSDGNYPHIYHFIKDWSKQLKINIPDTGINNLQLRIWIDIPGLSLRQRLIVINYNKEIEDFSAELFRFQDNRANARDMFSIIVNAKKIIKTPKSGWPSFTKKLFSDDFLLIFDKNNGYTNQAYMDSDSYCFEIITNRNYWFSDFGALHEEGENVKVVRLINKVFTLIEDEFDFQKL